MSGPAIFGIIVGSVVILTGIGKAAVWLYGVLGNLATKADLSGLSTKAETAAIATTLARKVEEQGVEDSTERRTLLDDQNKVLAAILEQTRKTNGTVVRHDTEIKELQRVTKAPCMPKRQSARRK